MDGWTSSRYTVHIYGIVTMKFPCTINNDKSKIKYHNFKKFKIALLGTFLNCRVVWIRQDWNLLRGDSLPLWTVCLVLTIDCLEKMRGLNDSLKKNTTSHHSTQDFKHLLSSLCSLLLSSSPLKTHSLGESLFKSQLFHKAFFPINYVEFTFYESTGIRTQGLALASQVLYSLCLCLCLE
jgi:hypothetical protein